jgi:hypothetical protein
MFKAKDFSQIKFDSKRAMAPPLNPLETRPTTASDRLVGFAEERGIVDEAGSPDLSGLHMQQEALEYVVNQHVVTSKTGEPLVKERDWRWPLSVDPDRSLRSFGRSSRRGGHTRVDKTSVIDLDVLDPDKKLLATLQFDSLDQFFDFVDSHEPEERRVRREKTAATLGHGLPYHLMNQVGNTPLPREPIDLGSLKWGDETKFKPPAKMEARNRTSIRIPRHAGAEPFGDVFRHRERLELAGELPGGSWRGLTLMKGARKLQVVQDSIRYSPEAPGTQSGRIFRIREYDEHGTEVKQESDHVYTFDALRDLINGSKVTNIYWEVPYTPERRERNIYRRFGWLATPDIPSLTEETSAEAEQAELEELIDRETAGLELLSVVGGKNTTRTTSMRREHRAAIWLLSGIEATTHKVDAKTHEANLKKMKDVAHKKQRVKMVEDLIDNYGLGKVMDLTLRLQDTFAACAEGLLLLFDEAALHDFSWAVESLAADLRHGKTPPFGNKPEAIERQHDIIDLHLGSLAAAMVIRHTQQPKEVIERADAKDAKDAGLDKAQPGEELKEAIRMVEIVYVSPAFEASLPDIVKDEVLKILHKITEDRKELSPGNKMHLGWLLRQAANTTL